MRDILNGLTGAAPAGAANAPADATAEDLHPLLAGLASGEIPGVTIPHGYESADAAALLPTALKLGLKLFKPTVDKSVQLAVLNPKTVDVAKLKKADQSGQLEKLFPSITEFFAHQDASAVTGTTTTGEKSAPDEPANGPSATPVPILAKGSPAPASVTRERLKNVAPLAPSAQPMPGAGLVLNGLLQRPI